jgi:hypothetical protein
LFALYLIINFSEGALDYETRLKLFNEVIRREGDEVALHLQTKWKLAFTFVSFFIYYYFLKFIEDKNLNILLKIVFFSSIFLFILGGLYTKFGSYIYPDPKLAMLTPVRSMYVYQLFFGILFCNFVINKFKNKQIMYVLLAAPFFISYGLKGLIVYVAIFSFLFLFSYQRISHKFSFSFLISILLLIIVLNSVKNRVKNFDLYTFQKLNHWSTFVPNDIEFKSFFINIRDCNDFMIYDELDYQRNANFFASKSRYFKKDSVALGLNLSILKETQRREKIIKMIKDQDLNLSIKDVKEISKENFLYLSKKDFNKKFYTIKKKFGNLIFIFDPIELEKLKNNCKSLVQITNGNN